ncbi:MAG: hypothetical protein AAGB00_06035 [Planctomycetota bacterium]
MPTDDQPTPIGRFSLRTLLAVMAAGGFFLGPIPWLGGMYVTALVVSSVLLAFVSFGVCTRTTAWPAAACLVSFAGVVAPPALLQGFATLLIVLLTHPIRQRVTLRLAACLAVMVAVYAVALTDARRRTERFDAVRAQYPVVSLADRLPDVPDTAAPVALAPAIEENLSQLEAWSEDRLRYGRRADSLRRLHTRAARQFTAATGFGLVRMPSIYLHDEYFAAKPLDTEPLTLQADDGLDLEPAQLELTARFFHPDAFGYVAGPGEAAGFTPHGVRRQRGYELNEVRFAEAARWRVERLELVGLLNHPEPVVYMLPGNPSMNQLAGAPTRPLDAFEAATLAKLLTSSDLEYLEDDTGGVRMLGAIRAAKQCLGCHQVSRGRLLGAFSYRLSMLPKGGAEVDSE